MNTNKSPRLDRGLGTAVCSDGRDPITAATLHDALTRACAEVGIVDRDVPADGRWHKTDIDGDPRGRGDGRIKLFADGDGGIVCNWKGETLPFFVDDGRKLTEAERRDRSRKRAESIRQAREEEARRHAEAARKASAIWKAAQPAPGDHPYLIRKRIQPHGSRLYRGSLVLAGMPCDGSLIVPACDGSGAIHTLQFIHPEKRDGDNKRFLPGGDYRGRYFSIGTMEGAGSVCVCEGLATGVTIHEATGYPVAVAFNAGNLGPVAQSLRARFPNSRLILCADDDAAIDGNPGLTKAREAARAVAGLVAVPDFGIRSAEADALGVRVSTLDGEVQKMRPASTDGVDGQGAVPLFAEVEPWPHTVNGAELLRDLAAVFLLYVFMPVHASTILALWVVHTFCYDLRRCTPILGLTSPQKRCGKTTLMSLLLSVVKRPLAASNISPSCVFRAIDLWRPTLLIDEADSFLRDNEELRGILDSGHTHELAYVLRNSGEEHEPRRFSTWAPKALALIGKLPATLHDRAIVVELARKTPGDRVERLADFDGTELRRRCLRWADDHASEIKTSDPDIPGGTHDRAADNWAPLLAIADAAGGDWPARARQALAAQPDEPDDSADVMLLADIREFFKKGADKVFTSDLLAYLLAIEARPWNEWRRGKALTARQLAGLSQPFKIRPGTKREGEDTFKGYYMKSFEDAFLRYLPADSSVTPSQPKQDAGRGDSSSVTTKSSVTDSDPLQPAPQLVCDGVTDRKGGSDEDRETGTI